MGVSHSSPTANSIHEFTVKDCSGKAVDLGIYKGKVLLVVNVASKCGLTDNNYTQLTELYNKYRNKDVYPGVCVKVNCNGSTGKIWKRESKRPTFNFAMKEELRLRPNHKHVNDPNQKLRMGDVVELTPAIPNKSLKEYGKNLNCMYDHDLTISTVGSLRS